MILAVPGVALATVGLAAILTAPEARPRHSSTRPHLGCASLAHVARATREGAPVLDVGHATAPVGSGGAGSSGAGSNPSATLSPTGEALSAADALTPAAAVAAVSAVDSASWLRSAALDPASADFDDRITVIGRVTEGPCETRKATPDANVTLWGVVPVGGEPVSDDETMLQLGSVTPELRRAVTNALAANPRDAIVEIASAAVSRDGRYTFAGDRSKLPAGTRLFATAWRLDGCTRLAAATEAKELPARDDSIDTVERAVLSLGTQTLNPTRRVTVLVESSGAPIAGACVVYSPDDFTISGMTDGRGRYELECWRGDAQVSVTRAGLSREVARIGSDADSITIDLGMPVSLSVRVIGPDGGPVKGSDVNACCDGGSVSHATTDENGHATLEGLASARSYSICASGSSEGLVPLDSVSVDAVTVPSAEVTVELVPGAALDVDFNYLTGLGRALETADITAVLERLREDGAWEGITSASTKERHLRFSNLTPGSYRVMLADSNSQHLMMAFTAPVEVKPGTPPHVSLDVGHGRCVSGWINDENGAAIDGEIAFEETTVRFETSKGWVDLRLPATPVHMIVKASGRERRVITIMPDQTWLGDMVLMPTAPTPPPVASGDSPSAD